MKTFKKIFLTLTIVVGLVFSTFGVNDTLILNSNGLVIFNGKVIDSLTINVGDTLTCKNETEPIGSLPCNFAIKKNKSTLKSFQNINVGFTFQFIIDTVSVPNITIFDFGFGDMLLTVTVSPITTGISEILNTIKFETFPNPVVDQLTIKSQSKLGIVKVINLSGQLILNEVINENITKVDFASLPKGLYIVSVGDSMKKIIK
jgi:hypothetical protein